MKNQVKRMKRQGPETSMREKKTNVCKLEHPHLEGVLEVERGNQGLLMSGHGAEHLAIRDDPVVRRERGSLPAVGGGSMGRRGDGAPHVGCGAVAADHRGLGGRAYASPGHGR